MIGETSAQHPRLSRLLSAYLDQELTPHEAAGVREHLVTCGACREELAALRSTKRLLAALPVRPLPAGFHQELEARIAEASRPAWQLWPRTFWMWLRQPLPAVAAAVVVILLLAIPLVRGQFDRLHAGEVGFDLYLRESSVDAQQQELLPDRAYLHLIVSDSNLVLVGEPPRRGQP